LSKAHAEELRHVLEPYIKAGRKTGSNRNGRAATDKDQAFRSWTEPSNTA
jgi:hypothetical protein